MMVSRPPSTTSIKPLQYAPALEAKYKIVPAMSCSSPVLCNGTKSFGNAPSFVPSPSRPTNSGADSSDGKTKVCQHSSSLEKIQ
jgi:hypothetical protein